MTRWQMENHELVLASASTTRAALLRAAGLDFRVRPAAIDEQAVKQAGIAEAIGPRDIAVTLAELKAQSVALSEPGYVLGCDQLLSCEGVIFSKPAHRQAAEEQLAFLAGKTHCLHTAIVLFRAGTRIWHYHSCPQLTMRDLSAGEIDDYLAAFEAAALSSPGCYQIENGGAHLFSSIAGLYYDILGLPLLPLLDILRVHGLAASRQAGTR